MKIPSTIATMLGGIALTLISLWVGQHHGLMPVAASEEAPLVDGLFNTMMTISVGLFILVQGAIVYAIFKFRQRPGDNTDGPPIEGNISLEILWTGIPVVIVLGLSAYSFEVYNSMGGLDPMASHDMGPKVAEMRGAAIAAPIGSEDNLQPPQKHKKIALGVGASPETEGQAADVTVNVMALQFAWIFSYPETGVYSGELHVPAGKEVQLNITAQDVLHAFWVPEFRLKQDAIPGREVELRFKPKVPGEYSVVCAELCGAYHGGMKTLAIVHTQEDFDAWMQSQVANLPDDTRTLAMNPADLSNEQFLAPYAAEMGITSETIEELHSSHHH